MTRALGVDLSGSELTPNGRMEHLLRLLAAQEQRFSLRMRAIEGGMDGIREQMARIECGAQMTEAQHRELARRVAEHLAGPMQQVAAASAMVSASALRKAYALGALLVALVTGGGGVYLKDASDQAERRQSVASARASAEMREQIREELRSVARRESFE